MPIHIRVCMRHVFTRHDEIEWLDPAIRCLTASAHHDESRLINALRWPR
jgi:hypothetical protein